MKNKFGKEIFRSITHSLGRFWAIFAIVALGAGFYAGIHAIAPDMRLTGDAYFDDANMMDVQLLSTFGFTEEDIDAVRQTDGVEAVMAVHSVDAEVKIDGNNQLTRIHGLPADLSDTNSDYLNRPVLVEGRLPEQSGECVVSAEKLQPGALELGDVIRLEDDTGAPIEGLKHREYTVVGSVKSAYYIALSYGSTSMGSGKLSMYMYVPDSDFDQEFVTDLYATVQGAKEQMTFHEEYEELVTPVTDRLKTVADQREQTRYDDIRAEAEAELLDGKKEYQEKKEDADKQFAEAAQELEDGRKEIAENEQKLADAEQEIADGRAALADGRAELADGERQLNDAKALVKKNRATLQDGQNKWDKGHQDFLDGKAAYESGQEKLNTQKETAQEQFETAQAEITQGLEELEQGRQQLEEQRPQYEAAQAALPTIQAVLENWPEEAPQEPPVKTPEQVLEALLAGSTDDFTYGDYGTAQAVLGELIAQFEQGEAELAAGQIELDEAQIELDAGKAEAEVQLKQAQKELDAAKEKLNLAKKELDATKAELDDGWSQLKKGERELENNQQKIADSKATLANAEAKLADAEREVADGKEELAQGKLDLEDGEKEYREKKIEADEKLAEAAQKIKDGEKELEELDLPEWYVLDRNTNVGYASFAGDTDRMDSLATVFPFLFFLVAALVALTTMTRMVEEERVLIGTYKALGYSNGKIASKYLIYAALASVTGSIVGILIAFWTLPPVCWAAYRILYTAPDLTMVFHTSFALQACLACSVCTLAATLFACGSTLRESPANLMLPKAPPAGKRILLERVGFVWKRLKFTYKVTCRNLFRYKKRFIMTVVGIAGCTALLVTGFGIQDSVASIVNNQYVGVYRYNTVLELKESERSAELEAALNNEVATNGMQQPFDGWMASSVKNVDIKWNGKTMQGFHCVPEQPERLKEMVNLRDRKTGTDVPFGKDSVVVTEKLADRLGIDVGDVITLQTGSEAAHSFSVTDVTENYVYHYVYIDPELYQSVTGKTAEYTQITAICTADVDQRAALLKSMLTLDGVSTASDTTDISSGFDDMVESLKYVILVLIFCAGALAFVVLYNLTNINVTERQRELATIKVLGFYDQEVSAYIYRETALLTVIGCVFGLLLGVFMHSFVIETVEVDLVMFGRNIQGLSFLYSAALTLFFSVVVNLVMHRKLKKIDMVESLKSVD